ncbi:hypothetical protein [Janthinobacterium sp. Ant5-2-1]|uniref:hypothetical protein n=1 Tax=Janthinobacterium sp. Ant5-2-1 TaxID=1755239 RepID=UPI000AFC5A0B|nr:hypothetical protein [Janthinobacterium sp. Ant5-2-1]
MSTIVKRSTSSDFTKPRSNMRAITVIGRSALKRITMWAYNHGWLSLSLTQWIFDNFSIHSA